MISRRLAIRRTWLLGLLGLSAAPLRAQPAGKVYRIGYLTSSSPASGFHEVFLHGLRELGWAEGKNIVIDFRFAHGRFDRMPDLAAELVRLEPDLIVAQPTLAAVSVSKATKTIPIVMINVGDPVGLGLIASLARPGGNVTGTAFSVGLETIVKGLQLFTEVVPKLHHVALLSNPANPAQALAISDLKAAAQALGVQILPVQARGPDDFDAAFAQMTRNRMQALLVVADSLFILHRARLADLALRHRLPTMHGVRENVEAGGLISYGPSLAHNARRAATYVDKILKGAKPTDLPVEQPTTFELVINRKTAMSLGITIPYSVLLRTDEVIQ